MRAGLTHFTPHMRVLSPEQIKDIHYAACEILERTGIKIGVEKARDILHSHGCKVDGEIVRFPAYLVESGLRTAPERFVMCHRENDRKLFFERGKSYFSPLVDNLFIIDPYTRERRQYLAKDATMMARLMDYTGHMDVLQVGGFAADMDPAIVDRNNVQEMMLNSRKAISFSCKDPEALLDIIEMAAIVAGGHEELKRNPYLLHLQEPISPLVYDHHAVEELMLCAEHEIPIVYYPIPMGGATAPATLAGILAQNHAESMAGLALHQLIKPGAPFLYGGVPCSMDMRYMRTGYGSPELYILITALADMAHHFNLPFWGCGGCSIAGSFDEQAAAEMAMSALISVLSGANLIHNTALLDQATLTAPEGVLFCDDVASHAKHWIGQKIDITAETLALDEIHRIGHGGNHLTSKHTRKHFKDFWVPQYFRNYAYKEDDVDFVAHLNTKVKKIIETHEVPPLPDDKLKQLKEYEKKWRR